MEITYNNEVRERFIPISYDELLSACLQYFQREETKEDRILFELIYRYYYYKFYPQLQNLKYTYQVFNPDNDSTSSIVLTEDDYIKKESEFSKEINPLLNDANYEVLTHAMLEETMNKTSPYGIEVSVDFDDFERIELHYRGKSVRTEIVRNPKKLYLKKMTITEPIYRRLFILIKPKKLTTRAEEIALRDDKNVDKVMKKLEKENPFLLTDESSNNIYIKLFKNIPEMDLQMLFPNTKVRMTLFDKLKLGILGGGGTITGAFAFIAKLGTIAMDPLSAIIAAGTFLGVLWRQVKEVIFRRTHYAAQLAKNLYYHSLDNNAGALNYMIDMAQDEESKESLLTYLFLLKHDEALTEDELDAHIEKYIKEVYNVEMDFEIDDGLNKLIDLGLLIKNNDKLRVVKIDVAIEILTNLIATAHLSE